MPRQQARRQGSVKQQQPPQRVIKKNDSSSMMLSPEHSPYEPQGFQANHLALSHPNLEELMAKQPPSYEAALARNMQGGMPGQQGLESQYSNFNPHGMQQQQQQPQQQPHNRQQSMPSSFSNHLSPPHSNLSSHHVQSPPHSTGAMSPHNPAVMSPPQSVTMSPPQPSQHSMSPPQQQQQHAQRHLSPNKGQLPTSPTHLAALRGATHQRHQASFDYSGGQQQQQFLYPTPPQEQLHNNSFMSPSPDSPDQWSSGASPQSHSDWSDGIHSPPALHNGQYQQIHPAQMQPQQQQQQHQQMVHQQTDAVII